MVLNENRLLPNKNFLVTDVVMTSRSSTKMLLDARIEDFRIVLRLCILNLRLELRNKDTLVTMTGHPVIATIVVSTS